MFLQAGFNPRAHGLRIFAIVWHRRVRWRERRTAELVCFSGGDLAWWGAGGISWGEQLHFCNLVHLHVLTSWETERNSCDIDAARDSGAR